MQGLLCRKLTIHCCSPWTDVCASGWNPWKTVKVKSTGEGNRKLSGWMKSYRQLWEPGLVPVKTDNTLRQREERQLEWTAVWRSVCGCCALTFPNTRLSDDIMEHKYDQRLQRGNTPSISTISTLKFINSPPVCLSLSSDTKNMCTNQCTQFSMPNCSLHQNLGGSPQQACALRKKVHKSNLRATWAKSLPHLCAIF